MSTSSFSNWLKDKRNEATSPSCYNTPNLTQTFGGDSEDTNRKEENDGAQNSLLQFTNVDIESGLESFRSSLEAQMPQKILGMNYQQRFKVGEMIV